MEQSISDNLSLNQATSILIGKSNGDLSKAVHQLFEFQVAKTPNKIAACFQDQSITYKNLNEKANQLARYLLAIGITQHGSIAIFLNRSIDCLVALLAVMKTGASYIPIDLQFPTKRIEYILTNAEVDLILIDSSTTLPNEIANYKSLCVNYPEIYQGPANNLDLAINMQSAVYCIFTSGSTGLPKGVVIPHQALTNYTCWAKKHYINEEIDHFAFYSPLTFDLTVTSIYVPLISGKTIFIYPETDDAVSVLHQVVSDNKIDILKLTPAHLLLLKNLDLSQSRIKTLILGGEDLKAKLALKILEKFPHKVAIYNEYGPTETTVGCMVYRFDPLEDLEGSVPIGQPIDHVQIYLLDNNLQPVKMGEAGEIYIAGDGLALGYKNNSELSAKVFVAHPFKFGSTLYASGDLGKIKNNQLIFIGRKDFQVKLRGYRIELGEIENILLQYPGIEEGIVDIIDSNPHVSYSENLRHCAQCGIASNFPNITFNENNVCNHCHAFRQYEEVINGYFSSMSQLSLIIEQMKRKQHAQYDCLVSLSGGKDSMYALCKMVDMGARILSFTLDNGYLSDRAKANINRAVASLGVDHRYLSTQHMKTIFLDSLKRHSDVCNGCFKTIYTQGINLAKEVGVSYIVTGLSKGQLFETRLVELFRAPTFDEQLFEKNLIEARKMYHRVEDAANQLLDNDWVNDDSILDNIHFIDFYRYCNVRRDEMYRYIEERVGWVRPPDTGRSTNCLLNDVAIYVHGKERGYHKYSLPYSWDVRMGHISKQEALLELDDAKEINVEQVETILQDIGYSVRQEDKEDGDKKLVAYYKAVNDVSSNELNQFMRQLLPHYMIPGYFVKMDQMPLTPNGKINRRALPRPAADENSICIGPRNDLEKKLVDLWKEILLVDKVSVEDNFFDLGGHSLSAIMLLFKINMLFNKTITIEEFSKKATISDLSQLLI